MSDENQTEVLTETTDETHPALTTLNQLRENGQINEETFNTLSGKFNKLHQAFTQSCSEEQILLRRTRELNKELKGQKNTIQSSAAKQQEHKMALAELTQHVNNIKAELDQTREQIESTKSNTEMKKKECEKLKAKVEQAREEKLQKLEPQKAEVDRKNKELEREIAGLEHQIQQLQDEGQDLRNSIQEDDNKLKELKIKKERATQQMLEVSSQPQKTQAKASAVESTHQTMLAEYKTVNKQLAEAETKLQELRTNARDLEVEQQHIVNDIDGMLEATSDMKVREEELKGKYATQLTTKQQRNFEKTRIQNQINETTKEIQGFETKLESGAKDISKKEKDAQKLKEAIDSQIMDKKTLEGQLYTLTQDKIKEEENIKKLDDSLKKAMAAKEEAFQQFVALEGITNEVMMEIKAATLDKDHKQNIHDQLSKKEHEIERQLTEISLIRDRKAREMASMKKKTLDAKIQAKEANLDYLELCRKQELIVQRQKEFSELYEKVKLDRNRYVNTIQTSRQLIVELKEKIRILDNEVEVLRKEFEDIDAEVKLKKNELDQAFKRRNATKSELKNAQFRNSEITQKIDFQTIEAEMLNQELRRIERHIGNKQDDYDKQTKICQKKQVECLTANDDIGMLTERLKSSEEELKRSEQDIRMKEEKTKILSLQLDDLQGRIEIMHRKVPQLNAYMTEIADLDKQLDREKADVDEITRKLEVPDEKSRPRAYCGKDFTLAELEQKVLTYEQRINAKGQQLWEKHILLKEIEEKIAELSKDSEKDASKADVAFKKSGNLKSEYMSLERKYKAAVAEMAYYSSKKQELEEEKKDLIEERQAAGERTQRGEDFDEVSRKIVQMHKRDLERKENPKPKGEFDSDSDDDNEPVRRVPTRPNAYRSSDIMWNPYGAFPAFQAAPPSGQLRHYRKETQRPIEL